MKDHFVREYLALIAFLGIACPSPATAENQDDPMLGVGPLLPFVQAAALRSGLTAFRDGAKAIDELLHRWVGQITSAIASEKAADPPTTPPTTVDGSAGSGAPIPPAPPLPPPPPPRQGLRSVYPFQPRSLRGSAYLATQAGGAAATTAARVKVTLADWVQNLGVSTRPQLVSFSISKCLFSVKIFLLELLLCIQLSLGSIVYVFHSSLIACVIIA